MTITKRPSACSTCARLTFLDTATMIGTCYAFVDRHIPLEILTGENRHDKPMDGDDGLTYLSKKMVRSAPVELRARMLIEPTPTND